MTLLIYRNTVVIDSDDVEMEEMSDKSLKRIDFRNLVKNKRI